MSTTSAIVLIPSTITAVMIAAGTSIPEIDAAVGEAAWSSTTSYAVGDRVVVDGAVWEAVASGSNRPPASNPSRWRRVGPSNRMAPFDDQMNTAAVATDEITYVLRPGFFSALSIYGLSGSELEITLYDGPGGPVIVHEVIDLYEQALGLYEYLFMPLGTRDRYALQDLPLMPDAELHITLRTGAGAQCSIGMIVLGFWETLLGASRFGGVEYGATAQIQTYSYIKTEDDGTTTIVPRHSATNVRASVFFDAEQANHAAELLHRIASRPVSFVATNLARYDYISTFGLVSGTVSPESYRVAKIDLNIKGYI